MQVAYGIQFMLVQFENNNACISINICYFLQKLYIVIIVCLLLSRVDHYLLLLLCP